MTRKNIIGPQLVKLRCQCGLMQKDMAAKLQLLGWNGDRVRLAKIEGGFISSPPSEWIYFRKVLNVSWNELLPEVDMDMPIPITMKRLLDRHVGSATDGKTKKKNRRRRSE